uniref:Uncharacterized protein n=1 Tax=Cacopsylla melanoneura TaxID=428564 RepID=A0A8D9EUZ8_9HEMI
MNFIRFVCCSFYFELDVRLVFCLLHNGNNILDSDDFPFALHFGTKTQPFPPLRDKKSLILNQLFTMLRRLFESLMLINSRIALFVIKTTNILGPSVKIQIKFPR